jgi:hypothetical protein
MVSRLDAVVEEHRVTERRRVHFFLLFFFSFGTDDDDGDCRRSGWNGRRDQRFAR